MIFSTQTILLLIAAFSCTLNVAFALNVDIKAHGEECFYEDIGMGDKLVVTYQVDEGGNYDIDFLLNDPTDKVIISSSAKPQGNFAIQAEMAGRYTYCFSNKMSTVTAKSVSFNAHINEKNELDNNNQEDPLKNEIEELADSILQVKAEQEYIVARERRHRDTAESTNTRVKWWSVGQICLLIAVCLWQVHYLKHFFEVKRAV